MIDLISEVVKEKDFDGIVFDCPYNFFENKRQAISQLIFDITMTIKKELEGK